MSCTHRGIGRKTDKNTHFEIVCISTHIFCNFVRKLFFSNTSKIQIGHFKLTLWLVCSNGLDRMLFTARLLYDQLVYRAVPLCTTW